MPHLSAPSHRRATRTSITASTSMANQSAISIGGNPWHRFFTPGALTRPDVGQRPELAGKSLRRALLRLVVRGTNPIPECHLPVLIVSGWPSPGADTHSQPQLIDVGDVELRVPPHRTCPTSGAPRPRKASHARRFIVISRACCSAGDRTATGAGIQGSGHLR